MALFCLYAGDYLSVRYLARHNHSPLGSVDIQVFYSVGLKGNKVEYMPADPETQTCIHSLFPQMGYQPCWYVNRHRTKWIDVCRRGTDLPFAVSALEAIASRE